MRVSQILAFLFVLLIGSALSAQEPITKAADRLIGGPDGAAWEIIHPSVMMSKDGKPAHPIVGPITWSDKTMYAVRGDLLTLDFNTGQVVGRQQYPGPIESLDVVDGKLFVTLDVGDRVDGEDRPMRVPYIDGSVPGRGLWDRFPPVALRSRAEVPPSLVYKDEFANHTGDWAAERKTLYDQVKRDLTNPLLPAYLGLAGHLDGDETAADAAFETAIERTRLWTEQFQLCGVLERAKRPKLAEAQCAAAKEGMKAAGVRPEAMLSLVAYVVISQDLKMALQDAVASGDAETVDRIASYSFNQFPNIEGGFIGWRGLALWFEKRGHAELAEKWNARASEAASSPVTKAFWGKARSVDFGLLISTAVMFMVPLAGLIAGLRRREDDEETWKPRFGLGHVVVTFALMLAMVPVTVGMLTDVGAIGKMAAAPMSVLQDGYGSPTAVRWIEDQPEGAARDELLDYAKGQNAAAAVGMRDPAPAPHIMILFEMVDEAAREEGTAKVLSTALPEIDGAVVPNALPLSIPGALAFLLCALFGRQVRVRSDKLANVGMALLPGAHAGPASPLLLAGFIAAVLFVATPIGSILQSIAMPSFGRFFGLDGASDVDVFAALYPADAVWPWVVVVVVLAVHIFSTRRALRE